MCLRHAMWHETRVVALGVRLKGGKAGGREGKAERPFCLRPSSFEPSSLPAFQPFRLSLWFIV